MSDLETLKATVRDYLNRPNLDAGSLVTQATGQLNRDLRGHPRTYVRRNYTQPANNPLLPLPDDVLAIVRLRTQGANLRQYPVTVQDEDIVEGFVARGNVLHVFPTPAVDQQYTLDYSSRLRPLSECQDTNWVLETFPDLYLYAALKEGSLYLKDADSHARFSAEYDRRLREVQLQGWSQNIAAGPRTRAI